MTNILTKSDGKKEGNRHAHAERRMHRVITSYTKVSLDGQYHLHPTWIQLSIVQHSFESALQAIISYFSFKTALISRAVPSQITKYKPKLTKIKSYSYTTVNNQNISFSWQSQNDYILYYKNKKWIRNTCTYNKKKNIWCIRRRQLQQAVNTSKHLFSFKKKLINVSTFNINIK